jgi:hypothetical protein
LLKEFFGNRTRYLPEGSVLVFGSLSHLAARGLESYAEEVVKIFKVFTNMLPAGCVVAHTVHAPLGGIESEGLIRDLFDLDSWLRSGTVSTLLSLPKSRETFWRVVRRENKELSIKFAERTLFLPESFKSSRKIRTISGETLDLIPNKIRPLSEQAEREIINAIMGEIADEYAVDIQLAPVLDRCSGDLVFAETDPDQQKIIVIGASHATRLVGGLAEGGLPIINLARPGWILDSAAVSDIAAKVKKHKPGPGDIVLIDPLSNSVFCGSDDTGNHMEPIKESGTWHITGNLCVRAKSYIRAALSKLKHIFDAAPDSKYIFISPLPRYITEKCCDNDSHIVNFGEAEYTSDISDELRGIDGMLDAIASSLPGPAVVLNYSQCADDPAADLHSLSLDGEPLWAAGDGVHGNSALYSAMAKLVQSTVDELGFDNGPGPSKRARLESIVVRQDKNSANEPAPSSKQSWSAGRLPAKVKRGRGAFRARADGAYRGRPWRGGSSSWRRPSGPPRGRGYGRWFHRAGRLY